MINYRRYTVFSVIFIAFITAMLVSNSLEQAFVLTELISTAFLIPNKPTLAKW